ncbi:MAG: hypothetical protein Q8Q00_12495 [Dehalococcoidia bacterium]|nr:hypothetical protein [Dehalococcoidia bacterium]
MDILAVDTDITNPDTVNGGAPNGNNYHERLNLGECDGSVDDDGDTLVDDGCPTGGTGPGGITPLGEVGDIDTCNVIPLINIVSSSVANPTTITTATPHGLATGDLVSIVGHAGSTPAINDVGIVTVTGANTFTIPVDVTGAGAGGTVSPTLEVDIVVDEIDPSNRMLAWTFNLNYDQAVVKIVGVDGVPNANSAAENRRMMIASEPDSGANGGFVELGAENPSSTVPDTNGQLVEVISDFGTLGAVTTHEKGEGVLLRVQLANVGGAGSSPLDLVGTTGNPISIVAPPAPGTQLVTGDTTIGNATVKVGQSCAAATPTPTPTATANATAERLGGRHSGAPELQRRHAALRAAGESRVRRQHLLADSCDGRRYGGPGDRVVRRETPAGINSLPPRSNKAAGRISDRPPAIEPRREGGLPLRTLCSG